MDDGLDTLHKQSWDVARDRATQDRATRQSENESGRSKMPRPSHEYFDPPPWRQRNRPRWSYHDYGTYTWNNQPNSGVLRSRVLLLSKGTDLGLCHVTFGTLDNCPLGQRCRWDHTIKWKQLRFLIVSGRVSVPRAQIMMANWCTPGLLLDLSESSLDNMFDIYRGLGVSDHKKVLKPIRKWTVPFANHDS
jgi:hypothetical protein